MIHTLLRLPERVFEIVKVFEATNSSYSNVHMASCAFMPKKELTHVIAIGQPKCKYAYDTSCVNIASAGGPHHKKCLGIVTDLTNLRC